MSRLGRYLALTPAERRLFWRAWATLMCIRLALWVLPFGRVRRLAARLGRPSDGAAGTAATTSVDYVVWAIESAARFVPAGSCLVRALAARALLRRAGLGGELRIGVARESGRLKAHAWVQSGSRVLVGDEHDLAAFTLLPALEGED